MALTSDLLSQFAKATKDTSKPTSERIVYGVVQKDTSKVKIDGSDIEMPVNTSVFVAEGDRVSVLIKNHEAVINGNISSPAARDEDTLKVVDLKAIELKIENLLTTHEADIKTLTAKDAEITDLLTAAEEDIETLKTSNNNIATELDNAAKTATNFIKLTAEDGLIVGDLTGTLGGNIQLKAESSGASISLRDGTVTLAKFAAITKKFAGVTSATTSTNSDTETIEDDSGTTSETTGGSSQTIVIDQSATVVKIESTNPLYFSGGLRTDKVIIDGSNFISNTDFTLNGTIFDKDGRSVLDPNTIAGNLTLGYGRFKNATASSNDYTIIYGNKVRLTTKKGAVIALDGSVAFDAQNANGNMTIGYHLYKKKTGNTNIYGGDAINFFTKAGGSIIVNNAFVPADNASIALGRAGSLGWSNIYIGNESGVYNGLRMIVGGSNENLCGMDEDGRYIFGNNSSIMYYLAKNVDTTTTGDAFKITSGNDIASNNTSSIWLFGAADSTSRHIGSYLAYNRTYSSAGNMYVTSNGVFGRSASSSQRYKEDITVADKSCFEGLYDLPVKKFKYKSGYLSGEDERCGQYLYDFVVEDLVNVLPCAVDHITDEDGNSVPEMWNSNIIVPALLKLIQDLNTRVKNFEQGGVVVGAQLSVISDDDPSGTPIPSTRFTFAESQEIADIFGMS